MLLPCARAGKKLSALTASSVGRSKAGLDWTMLVCAKRPVGADAQLGHHDAVEHHVGGERGHAAESARGAGTASVGVLTVAGGVPMVMPKSAGGRKTPSTSTLDATGRLTGDAPSPAWRRRVDRRLEAPPAHRGGQRLGEGRRGPQHGDVGDRAARADPDLERNFAAADRLHGNRRRRAAAQPGRGPHQVRGVGIGCRRRPAGRIGNRRWRPLREIVLGDDAGRRGDGLPPGRFGRGHSPSDCPAASAGDEAHHDGCCGAAAPHPTPPGGRRARRP